MQVVWGDGAQADFEAAIEYLRAQSPMGATRMGERILEAVGLLERFPELAPPSKHRGLRQLVVPRTPYLVIYRIKAGQIEIRAVVHAKQRRRKQYKGEAGGAVYSASEPRTLPPPLLRPMKSLTYPGASAQDCTSARRTSKASLPVHAQSVGAKAIGNPRPRIWKSLTLRGRAEAWFHQILPGNIARC